MDLDRLARNARWTWDPRIRDLFRHLDPDLWETTGGVPTAVLRQVSQARLDHAAADAAFVTKVQALASTPLTPSDSDRRARTATGLREDERLQVAYFCAEYGWHESLAAYSGGLGILAGDHTKAASDLGVPMVAVGLWYRDGYFRQAIDRDGMQSESTVRTEPTAQGFERVTGPGGAPIEVHVTLWGRSVTVQAWRLDVGTVPVLMLDVDVDNNAAEDRAWTNTLYGGDRTTRIVQEVILGIAGVRMVRAAGFDPTCWHMNEGHSAFMVLERCRELVAAGVPFDVAHACVAADTVFTVHTPVPAGNDAFDEALVLDVLRGEWPSLGIEQDTFLAYGRFDHGWGPAFSMPALALRTSSYRNGVAALHGRTSRRAWRSLWPGRHVAEVPIGHVTNGVHAGTWVAPEITAMVERACAAAGVTDEHGDAFQACVRGIDLAEAWNVRQEVRAEAAHVWRRRAASRGKRLRLPEAHRTAADAALAAGDVLTIGFARRFATYKRADLIAHDPDRLAAILSLPARPVRLLFAGKAHPADEAGRATIEAIARLERDPRFAGKIFLLEDYDMELGRALTRGVDVWLNNPRRPLEASGTSGQKAAMNGVLNLSILDGWWPEGYDGSNGWAIPHARPSGDAGADDAQEALALYDILENEVVPCFFDRDEDGVPRRWMQRSLDAIATVTPAFSARRMVSDYLERAYIPASRRGAEMRADASRRAYERAEWVRDARAYAASVQVLDASRVPAEMENGQVVTFRTVLRTSPDRAPHPDAAVEALVGPDLLEGDRLPTVVALHRVGDDEGGGIPFEGSWTCDAPGAHEYAIRLVVRGDGMGDTWPSDATVWATPGTV